MTAEILVAVPENLAHKAKSYGIFNSQAIVTLLRAEVVRLEHTAEDDEPLPWANMTDQELRDSINEAYADFPDEEERKMMDAMRYHQRRMLENEW